MSLVAVPLSPKYVFFGSAAIAPAIIEEITRAGMPPALLVCNPDRPAGRKKVMTPPPAKTAAERLGIPVFQPEDPAEIADALRAGQYDVFVVAAYAKILPDAIIDIPPRGTVGVHPSLLPRYRGASPIKSVILDGAPETGVTLYRMDRKMDHGPVVAQEKLAGYAPDAETDEVLTDRLARLAGDMLLRTLPRYAGGEIDPVPQDETAATFTKKFVAADGYVEPDDLARAVAGSDPASALRIHRMVLALGAEPGVWTMENGKRKKLLAAECRDGTLVLKTVQYEGERPISEG